MKIEGNNYAFIDSQNLNLSIQEQGWKLDFKRFRKYLEDKYGITKERIRQLHKSLYGKPYSPIKKRKTQERAENETSCINDPRRKYADYKRGNTSIWKGVKTEKMFFDECERRGLNPEILCSRAIDIKINGYLIDVKSAYRPFKMNRDSKSANLFRRYAFRKKQRDKCDFFACWHDGEKNFFIIPKEEIKKNLSNCIYISNTKSDHYNSKNRYWEYKDAFNLLAN